MNGGRRRDEPSHRAIELPFRGERLAPELCQRRLRVVGAPLEVDERDGGGELGPANRKPQAVAGNGIDEPGRVARDEQARDVAVDGIDGERAQDDRPAHEAGGSEPIGQMPVTIDRSAQDLGGLVQSGAI